MPYSPEMLSPGSLRATPESRADHASGVAKLGGTQSPRRAARARRATAASAPRPAGASPRCAGSRQRSSPESPAPAAVACWPPCARCTSSRARSATRRGCAAHPRARSPSRGSGSRPLPGSVRCLAPRAVWLRPPAGAGLGRELDVLRIGPGKDAGHPALTPFVLPELHAHVARAIEREVDLGQVRRLGKAEALCFAIPEGVRADHRRIAFVERMERQPAAGVRNAHAHDKLPASITAMCAPSPASWCSSLQRASVFATDATI